MTDEKTLRAISVDTLNLSTRALHVLHRAGWESLSALLSCTEEELYALPNAGKKTVEEILRKAEECRRLLESGSLPAPAEAGPAPQADAPQAAPEEQDLQLLAALPQNRETVLQYVRLRDQSVDAIGLKARAVNQLQKNGYRLLSEILFLTPEELQALRSMGAASVQNVLDCRRRWLEQHEEALRAALSGDPAALQAPAPEDKDVCWKLLRLYEAAPDAGLSDFDFAEQLPAELSEAQRRRCVGKLLAEGKLEYVDFRCYRVYPRFADAVRACPKLDERNREIILHRLQGETLDAAAQRFGLTRERVRQIINDQHKKIRGWNAMQTGMPQFDEDYYRYFYETYEIEKQDAEAWLGLSVPVLRYLDLLIKVHRRRPLEEALEDQKLGVSLRQRIRNYLNRDKLYLDGQWLPKQREALERYVVTHDCTEDAAFSDFCERYNAFLREQEIPFDEEIYITDAVVSTRKNKLRDDRFLLWKQGERLRAYDIDGRDYAALLDELGLEAYENVEISTLKLFEEHPEQMAQYDIRDQYELHNLLRKLLPEGGLHDLKFRRAPNLLFGVFDRDAALLELMTDHAPISQAELADLIRQEYGYDTGVIIGTYLIPLSAYYHQGIYDVDQKFMPAERREALQAALDGDFFFLDELKRIYLRCVPGADAEEINPYNLKQMGFTVFSRYALRNYPSLDAFFRALLTADDLVDLTPLRRRYGYVMMFSQTLNELKRGLEVVEYEPNKLIRFEKLAAAGVTRQDVQAFRDAVWAYVEPGTYFSAASLRQSGFDSPLYELGFGDWFYGSLLSTDPRFSYGLTYKAIILYRGEAEVTACGFETALIRAEGSMDVYDLQRLLEQTYGCTVSDRLDLIYKAAGSGVYYDKHLDRLYDSEARFWRELDETEGRL